MRALRSKLTYANVISTLCLFIVLGGGAYAASQLPKNSVGAKQIKNGVITGKEIKKGSIDASKLTTGAVATLKGARGDVGPVGAQGAQGPQGLTNGGAYATVGIEEGQPFLAGSHTGFAAVEKPEGSDGVYCLTPSAGTNTDHPIASIDWAGSGGGKARFVEPLANGIVFVCAAGQLEVRTFELFEEEEAWVPLPSNGLGFTVFAPGV